MRNGKTRFEGIFYDGQTAVPHAATFTLDPFVPVSVETPGRAAGLAGSSAFMEICDSELGHEIAHWNVSDIYEVPSGAGELRLAANGQPPGARLVVSDPATARSVRQHLPVLKMHRKRHRGRQARLIGLITLATASVVAAYVYGVPLLASQIVNLIPPETEVSFGETIVAQLDSALEEQGGLKLCDSDSDSLANRAIARFASQALEGVATPFQINIQVADNDIPNAFALPGGHAYYFSALLEKTRTRDEFAGVMAHEIGHVVHRHGMQQLVSTAGTGLLVGFVLGDITGLSLAGGLGAALINNGFSREAEREADQFSSQVAARLGFDASAFPDLLDRISQDDEFSRALAFLSTHPLNQERRLALQASAADSAGQRPPFSDQEWAAIQTMCSGKQQAKNKTK